MKRVAIPIENGKLSQHFGHCNFYTVFKIENGVIISQETKLPPNLGISAMPQWAFDEKISDIITHKIDGAIMNLFHQLHINLFVGVEVKSEQELISDYLFGKTESDKKIINEILNTK